MTNPLRTINLKQKTRYNTISPNKCYTQVTNKFQDPVVGKLRRGLTPAIESSTSNLARTMNGVWLNQMNTLSLGPLKY